jgi:hypothetical protein
VLEWLRVPNSREFIPYHTQVLITDPLESVLMMLYNVGVESERTSAMIVIL